MIADTLSRMFEGYPCEEASDASQCAQFQINSILTQLPMAFESLLEFQEKDPSLKDLIRLNLTFSKMACFTVILFLIRN